MTNLSHTWLYNKTDSGYLILVIKEGSKNVEFLTSLYHIKTRNEVQNATFAYKIEKYILIEVKVQQAGEYKLVLSLKKKGQKGSYTHSNYWIIQAKGMGKVGCFPFLYPQFHEYELRILDLNTGFLMSETGEGCITF